MGDPIDFAARLAQRNAPDEDETEWLSGEVICAGCKHTWSGAAPAGTEDMQCPACSASRGVWRYSFRNVDVPIWKCATCDGFLYEVRHDGVMCVGCGGLTTYTALAEAKWIE